MDSIFQVLFYGLELKPTGILLGVALIGAHAFALVQGASVKPWLQALPRNNKAGAVILGVALIWSLIVVARMDLGEFHSMRTFILVALPVAYFLVVRYVDEFLAVRAIGTMCLLLACPVLGAAFLREPATRLLLPILAYAWILLGMFWVGMPYLLRDQIAWATASEGRWKGLCLAGIGYGALVLLCAILFY